MDKRAVKLHNDENQPKKPLKRPPFFAGYGNVKTIQSRPAVELSRKPNVVFALKQNFTVKKSLVPLKLGENVAVSNRIENDKSKASQIHVLHKRTAKEASQNHVIQKRTEKVASQKLLPKSGVQNPLPSKSVLLCLHKKNEPKKPQVGQKSIQKSGLRVGASTDVKSQHPQSAILDPAIWLLLTEWCKTNKKNVSDFFYFLNVSKPADKKLGNAPATKILPDVKLSPLEKHLNRLVLYLQKEHFPPGLMFNYLTNLAENVTAIKEYSTFWTILAECKMKYADFSEKQVFKVLLDAYRAKAKPPGKLIETYENFVGLLMEKLAAKVENAENVESRDEVVDKSRFVAKPENSPIGQKDPEAVVATGDVSQLLKEDIPKIDTAILTPLRKSVIFATPLVNESEEEDDVATTAVLTPFRRSVIFADPVVEESEEDEDVLESAVTTSDDSSEAVPILEKIEAETENFFAELPSPSSLVEFKTPDSSMFLNPNSTTAKSTGQRRTDVFDPLLTFQSSQRKYAVLSEKNKGTPVANYLTPVRRSTRIEQEQDVLPEMLQEKLTLYDSPFQASDENIEIRRNSALRNSFGGGVLLSNNKWERGDDEVQDKSCEF